MLAVLALPNRQIFIHMLKSNPFVSDLDHIFVISFTHLLSVRIEVDKVDENQLALTQSKEKHHAY